MPCLPQSLMTFIRKAILFMVPVIVVLGLIPKAKADGISYTLTDLGSGNWEYSYTITNTDEASGLYVFDIYFPSVSSTDALNYSNITETANPDSTNWITTVFPPSAPNLGGIYDAVALNTPIALGQSLSGFSVSFNYALTKQLPVIGPQDFEIYDSNYNLLETGTTVQAAVPEASTLVLLVSGIFALLGLLARKRI